MSRRCLVLLVCVGLLPIGGAARAERRGLTLPSPCPGPNCTAEVNPAEPTAQGLRTVYLNFDGVTLTASSSNDDARDNVSAILAAGIGDGQTRTIGPFDPAELWSTGGLSRTQIIQRVVGDLYELHEPYNVEFVTERPTSGNYHMVVFGGSCASVAGMGGCAGIALQDCGDYLPNNVVFVFPEDLRIADLATTAAQETAHAFGLSHTLDTEDVMYPTIQSSIPHHFGAGQIPQDDEPCGGGDFQDSDAMMMSTIGFRGQDTIPPAVEITSPEKGAVVDTGSPVIATVNDGSAIDRAQLMISGEVFQELTSPPWEFSIPAEAPTGDLLVTVRAYDDSDNMGFDRIPVYRTSGEEQSCTEDEDCPAGSVCSDDLCVPDGEESGALGDVCEGNQDCLTGQCASSEGESRCSQSCSAEEPCPEGFECRGEVACWPKEEAGGGCSLGSGRSAGSGLLLLASVLAWVRRRGRS